jgi:hypothetical protein
MDTLSLPNDTKRPWYREPMVWLIAGLPLTAVVAGLTTVWIAGSNPDPLVKEGYRKDGFTIQESLEVDRAAARLGIRATLAVDGDTLVARLSGGLERPPARLSVTLVHPTEATMDVEATLDAVGAGVYRVSLPPLPAGKRTVILESKEQGWRLRAPWTDPFAGQLELAAHPAGS